MTKLEEYLMIQNEMLETMIYCLTDAPTANTLISRANDVSTRMCLSEKTKEMIEQCRIN